MGLTLLLIMIYIFVVIKIIIACPACICKWAIKIVSKEMLQTHADILIVTLKGPQGQNYLAKLLLNFGTQKLYVIINVLLGHKF